MSQNAPVGIRNHVQFIQSSPVAEKVKLRVCVVGYSNGLLSLTSAKTKWALEFVMFSCIIKLNHDSILLVLKHFSDCCCHVSLCCWRVAVKLAVWEALLTEYVDSIEWVLEVLPILWFSCCRNFSINLAHQTDFRCFFWHNMSHWHVALMLWARRLSVCLSAKSGNRHMTG